jgi:hypothetical protein
MTQYLNYSEQGFIRMARMDGSLAKLWLLISLYLFFRTLKNYFSIGVDISIFYDIQNEKGVI